MPKGILLAGLIPCLIAASSSIQAALPDGTKGTLNLSVAVQDELGVDTVSEMVELKNVKASEVEGFIKSRLSRWGTVQTNDALNMVILTDKKEKLRDLSALVRKLDDRNLKDFLRLETVSIPLKYMDPNAAASAIRGQLSSEGILFVDSPHNALVVTDLRSKIDSAKKILENLDSFVPQIVFDVNVVERQGDDWRQFGVDWGFLSASFRGSADVGASTAAQDNQYNNTYGGAYNYNYNYGAGSAGAGASARVDMNSVLSALANDNKSKLSVRTRLQCSNNEIARFRTGNPFGSSFSFYSPWGGPPQAEPIRDEGLALFLLPRVGSGGEVTLSVDASLATFSGWSSTNNPILDSRNVNSKTLLRDGDTLLLGGLEKSVEVENEKGLPILRVILPFVFSRRVKSVVKTEVAIFVTVHVSRAFAAPAEIGAGLPQQEAPKAKP